MKSQKVWDLWWNFTNLTCIQIPTNIARNSSDLEERVSALETEMGQLELGLATIADNMEELQEGETVQDERILFLEQDIDELEDGANGRHRFVM